jgi:hypothetical protein
MQPCQLKELHAQLPLTDSHIEGSKPINCILGSSKISDHIIQAGYTALWRVLESNHRGLFIIINADAFMAQNNKTSRGQWQGYSSQPTGK